ncbi:2-(acetamidomethylene)succinate hydrolase [Georgenia soli]|uniref:2-(Acetamidomethylene)succinate hydrolase n=1 Tax=Georgenia soli TaxID=638953 RepID=A0A2A9EMN1_9MICO|nr:alpha/beta hydrolase [Georgenia soli]PFG39522.1 2-(acetamidomethylene)succinate hydrolase [Georgenia soli]
MTDGLELQQCGDLRLCIRDRGAGNAVVLLHGTTANLGVWDDVVELLGDGVRTVAVDQRGHGRSGKPLTGYGAGEYSDDVAALIRTLGLAPAVVVGHSLGARNAVVLAARHPELVAGVVAVDYTPFVEGEVLDDLKARVAAGDRIFETRAEVERYLRKRYPLITEQAVARRAAYGYTATAAGYRPLADPAAMAQTVDGLRTDFVDEASSVEAPVTLVRGRLSRIVSDDAFRRTRELRPDFRAVELPEVDHYVPEERPDIVADEIRHLLARTLGRDLAASTTEEPATT